jgi:predicted RND superfamily exporter protein
MKERIASVITDILYRNPGLIALVIVIIVGLSGWQMSKLTINYNQLELIPQDLPSVLATKRMFNLAGGLRKPLHHSQRQRRPPNETGRR